VTGPLVVEGVGGLDALVGKTLGTSRWRAIGQDDLDRFAEAVGMPPGDPVAPGDFLLSLAPSLVPDILAVRGTSMGVNYGLDAAVFPAPVAAGDTVRLSLRMLRVTEVPGGVQSVLGLEIEVEGRADPGCRAEVIYRYYT